MIIELLNILQHSLGCDPYGQTKHHRRDEGDGCWHFHRNRFVTDHNSSDGKRCLELVAMGFMEDKGPVTFAGGMHCFTVTLAGRDAMIIQSPKPPKVSKAQRRYRAFMNARDAFADLTFQEYLTAPHFAESRARA